MHRRQIKYYNATTVTYKGSASTTCMCGAYWFETWHDESQTFWAQKLQGRQSQNRGLLHPQDSAWVPVSTWLVVVTSSGTASDSSNPVERKIEQNCAFEHFGQRAIQCGWDRDQDGCFIEVSAIGCPCVHIATEIYMTRLGLFCCRDTWEEEKYSVRVCVR